MEDGRAEILLAFPDNFFGGGAGIGRWGVVEGGHLGNKCVIFLDRRNGMGLLRERGQRLTP